jgi:hypothetical protein
VGGFSPEFWAWCNTKWAGQFGQQEMSLLEWLTSLSCRSEIADYINQVIGNQPGAGAFVAEFLKRKEAEAARLANPGKKKKASGGGGGGDWQGAGPGGGGGAKGGKAVPTAARVVAGGGGKGKSGKPGNGFALLGMR